MGFISALTNLRDSRILFIFCLFGVLRRFQHCTGHITTGSWKGRGNQYIWFARVLYCKLPTNGKQLPAFPLTAMTGIEPRPQRWEARVLPLCHRGPEGQQENHLESQMIQRRILEWLKRRLFWLTQHPKEVPNGGTSLTLRSILVKAI